jgi:hypothetical protein
MKPKTAQGPKNDLLVGFEVDYFFIKPVFYRINCGSS